MSPNQVTDPKIIEFIDEMAGFAKTAEETLSQIEKDPENEKGRFTVFSDRMFTIRGTALQLNLPHIAHIAGLGEEIALKAKDAATRAQIRKCLGSLWDALSTIKYLLENHLNETSEEQQFLITRLEDTLRRLGGARPTISESDIEALLRQRS